MRALLLLLLAAPALAYVDERMPEEDLDYEEDLDRLPRDLRDEEALPCEDECRSRRSKRQVHQYEVYEEESEPPGPSPPRYEELLAASAEHHQRVLRAPNSVSLSLSPLPYVLSESVPAKLVAPSVQVVPAPHAASLPALSPPVPFSLPQDQVPAGGHPRPRAHHHALHVSHGGGKQKNAHSFKENAAKGSKGYESDHHVDKGTKGHRNDELHKKQYEEAAGKKKKHHDKAGHKGSHEEEAHGHKGSKFDEKKGHKKGHKTKGYHNKYHKDEYHKEHKFYDDYHKSGEHHRYGKFHAKHASDESGKKQAHHVDAGHDYVEKGKKGYSNKGHVDADHRGYRGKHGHEKQHEHHEDKGKKGGKQGGSHWGHQKKN